MVGAVLRHDTGLTIPRPQDVERFRSVPPSGPATQELPGRPRSRRRGGGSFLHGSGKCRPRAIRSHPGRWRLTRRVVVTRTSDLENRKAGRRDPLVRAPGDPMSLTLGSPG